MILPKAQTFFCENFTLLAVFVAVLRVKYEQRSGGELSKKPKRKVKRDDREKNKLAGAERRSSAEGAVSKGLESRVSTLDGAVARLASRAGRQGG